MSHAFHIGSSYLLVPPEGKLPVKSVVGVDPDSSCTERVGNLNGSGEVGCVYSGSKTVCGVVTNLDNVGLCLELGDCADGAEDLFLLNLHVLGYVGEDCGLDEVTLVTLTVATSLDGRARLLALLDVAGLEVSNDILDGGGDAYPMIRSNWSCET
jgi:hypothetical protein